MVEPLRASAFDLLWLSHPANDHRRRLLLYAGPSSKVTVSPERNDRLLSSHSRGERSRHENRLVAFGPLATNALSVTGASLSKGNDRDNRDKRSTGTGLRGQVLSPLERA